MKTSDIYACERYHGKSPENVRNGPQLHTDVVRTVGEGKGQRENV